MLFEKKARLVMTGDSVTDCGRPYEAKAGTPWSHGDGYVNLVYAFLTALYPEKQIMVINTGKSGNTIVELEDRWQEEVLALKPDWISVLIGVNDVWRQFDGQLEQCSIVDKETFRKKYEGLIQQTLPQVKGMILMGPFMIEENKEQPMRKMVEEYAEVARTLAEKYDLLYIDLQKKMNKFLESLSSYHISQDRVHPNIKGHMIIAKAFMDAIGTDWTKE